MVTYVTEAEFAQVHKFYDEKFRMQEIALALAQEANNHRLDGMNEFRGSLADQTRLLISRTEVNAMIDPLRDRVERVSHPNYAVLGSFASLILGSVAALWLVIGLKIDVSNAPIMTILAQLHINNATQDDNISAMRKALETGKTDRLVQHQLLVDRVIRLEDAVQFHLKR